MIGVLPKMLKVGGVDYPINTDYRAALLIFEALSDNELSRTNKILTMLEILFGEKLPDEIDEAQKSACWYLNVGLPDSPDNHLRTMSWEQDEQLIFSAVNAVVGKDVRECDYMHWWTFYGLCQSISPDALISHIVHIRTQQGKGKRLEKWEQDFYCENRHLIDMKQDDDFGDILDELREE